MNKTISTLALTLLAGAALTTGLPAADAEAHVSERTKCVQKADRTNATNCSDRVRRKLQRPTPTGQRQQIRRFNFTTRSSFDEDDMGGGGPGGGGGGQRSDIRLKRDIAVIGKLPNGLKLYKFKYLWSDVEWVGVMAQEVLNVAPEAVVMGKDGYYRVRYDLLGTSMQTFDQWQAEMARIHDLPYAA